jgi:hypothetical protein
MDEEDFFTLLVIGVLMTLLSCLVAAVAAEAIVQ